jgi:hypothetical protein
MTDGRGCSRLHEFNNLTRLEVSSSKILKNMFDCDVMQKYLPHLSNLFVDFTCTTTPGTDFTSTTSEELGQGTVIHDELDGNITRHASYSNLRRLNLDGYTPLYAEEL